MLEISSTTNKEEATTLYINTFLSCIASEQRPVSGGHLPCTEKEFVQPAL